jgi:hypothetical protein
MSRNVIWPLPRSDNPATEHPQIDARKRRGLQPSRNPPLAGFSHFAGGNLAGIIYSNRFRDVPAIPTTEQPLEIEPDPRAMIFAG